MIAKMFRCCLRRFYFQKFKSFLITITLIILISILTPILIFLDTTCVSQLFEPNLSLIKKSFINSKAMEYSPKWTSIVDEMISLYSAFYYNNKMSIIAILRKDLIQIEMISLNYCISLYVLIESSFFYF